MFYSVLCYRRCSSCCVSTQEGVTDIELTVGNNGVSTLGDGTDTELTAIGKVGVPTLEDGRDTDLTAVGINNTQIVVDNEISPPNESPLPIETPIVPQQTAGFYTQASIPHQAVSLYHQPRAPSRPYPQV